MTVRMLVIPSEGGSLVMKSKEMEDHGGLGIGRERSRLKQGLVDCLSGWTCSALVYHIP